MWLWAMTAETVRAGITVKGAGLVTALMLFGMQGAISSPSEPDFLKYGTQGVLLIVIFVLLRQVTTTNTAMIALVEKTSTAVQRSSDTIATQTTAMERLINAHNNTAIQLSKFEVEQRERVKIR